MDLHLPVDANKVSRVIKKPKTLDLINPNKKSIFTES